MTVNTTNFDEVIAESTRQFNNDSNQQKRVRRNHRDAWFLIIQGKEGWLREQLLQRSPQYF